MEERQGDKEREKERDGDKEREKERDGDKEEEGNSKVRDKKEKQMEECKNSSKPPRIILGREKE